MTVDASELTELERKFCEAYAGVCEGNGVRAAKAAGYSGDYGTLATQAWRLLKKADIREYLTSLVESDELAMGRIERIRMLTKIARGKYTETRISADGEPYEMNVPAKDIIAAIKELGLLSGDYVTKIAPTNAAGDDLKGWTMEQLLALTQMKVG